MAALLTRVEIMVAIAVLLALAIWAGRGLVRSRQARALAVTAPAELLASGGHAGNAVRILVFRSDDCTQCHTLQAPAIEKVLATRGAEVAVLEVDAPTSPELTHLYGILTLPSTIVLDATGRTRAANFGFASATKLLAQVDAVLAGDERVTTATVA
ncbi:MAG TPA: thioredoxin family protein [Ktedonobacterales bacterium]